MRVPLRIDDSIEHQRPLIASNTTTYISYNGKPKQFQGKQANNPVVLLVRARYTEQRKGTDRGRFFKTLTDQVITVELKNDLSITGTLKSVDQYVVITALNILTLPGMEGIHGTRS